MKLDNNYTESIKKFPLGVTLTNNVDGYYFSKNDKKVKKIKIKNGTYFNISVFENDMFKNNFDNIKDKNLVNSDLIATFQIEKGKKIPENTFFIYEDLLDNSVLQANKMLRTTNKEKSVTFFGIPKTYLFTGIGILLMFVGYKIYNKNKK